MSVIEEDQAKQLVSRFVMQLNEWDDVPFFVCVGHSNGYFVSHFRGSQMDARAIGTNALEQFPGHEREGAD